MARQHNCRTSCYPHNTQPPRCLDRRRRGPTARTIRAYHEERRVRLRDIPSRRLEFPTASLANRRQIIRARGLSEFERLCTLRCPAGMTRRIKITGYRLKAGELVPCYKHLPVNIHSCRSAQANECGSAARRVS